MVSAGLFEAGAKLFVQSLELLCGFCSCMKKWQTTLLGQNKSVGVTRDHAAGVTGRENAMKDIKE